MKTILFCSMLTLSAVPLAVAAEEASSNFSWGELILQPRIYAGYADYKLKSSSFDFVQEGKLIRTVPIDFFDSPNKKITNIQFSGLLGGVGGTIAYGAFFGDIYYQSTLDKNAYSGEIISANNEYSDYKEGNAKHADWAFSLGYAINDYWSIFAGYKSGKTEWDQEIKFTGSSLLDAKKSGDFEQDGPFLGFSYSYPIGPGSLTFKAAHAYLDGTETTTIRKFSLGEETHLRHQLDGTSKAFSVGLSWTQSLTDNLGFSINGNYHRYKFDLSGGKTEGSYTINSVGELKPEPDTKITDGSLTEDLFSLTASLTYRF